MSKFKFTKAVKSKAKLRLAIDGPSGSGKTYTALAIATHLVPGGKIRLIDSERDSALLYSDLFNFEHCPLPSFAPQDYVEAIHFAEEDDGGCDVIIADSISHAWMGKGGALEQLDAVVKRSKSKNSFDAWRDITPVHNTLVDAMVQCKTHFIATMRTKTEYARSEENGKTKITKVGMAPIQRDGMEYEFTMVGDMDLDHNLIIGKTRCYLVDGKVYHKPGREPAETLIKWLNDGVEPPPFEARKPPQEEEHPQAARIRLPKFKEIFDELAVPEAARLAAADKYRADDKLLEVIKRRLEEKRSQTTAPPAAAAAAESPKEGGPQ